MRIWLLKRYRSTAPNQWVDVDPTEGHRLIDQGIASESKVNVVTQRIGRDTYHLAERGREGGAVVFDAIDPPMIATQRSGHVVAVEARAVESADEVEVSFSSEEPVNQWGMTDVLSHRQGDADFSRLAEVGGILRNHDPDQLVGVPTRVWLDEKSRKGRLAFRFGSTDIARQARTEVMEDRTLRGVSVGYMVKRWMYFEEAGSYNGREIDAGTWLAVQWQALEASLTPVPADPSVGVGRSTNGNQGETTMLKLRLLRAWKDHKAGETISLSATEARTLIDQGIAERVENQNQNGDQPGDNSDGGESGSRSGEGNTQPQSRQPQSRQPEPAANPTRSEPSAQESPADVVRRELQAERARCREIRALGERHGIDLGRLIDSGASIQDAQSYCLEVIGERQANRPSSSTGTITMGESERSSFRRAAITSLCLRGGVRLGEGEERETGGSDLAGLGLVELARECLRRANMPHQGNGSEVVSRAMMGPPVVFGLRANETISVGVSDFPYILANTANKAMINAAMIARTTYRRWCRIGTGTDFKTMSRLKLSESGDLEVVPEFGDYKHTKFGEQRETIQIVTYGKAFNLSRQAIINDDLQAFTDIPAALGRAAALKPNKLAVTVLLSNPTMSDNVSLFASGHANYNSASGNAVNDTLAKARAGLKNAFETLMKQTAFQHTDISGEQVSLNLMPDVVLCGPSGIFNVREALRAGGFTMAKAGTTDASDIVGTDFNPLQGYAEPLVEPELENSNITGNSAAAFYVFASPAESPVIEVAFLNGVQTPYMEEVVNTGTAADGRVYKVRLDCAAAAIDYKGAFKEVGA